MSRKLASIVTIAACDPIPNADRLSVATMNGKGWQVVTGRDEYKAGDKAVYFEIDSYLPADDKRYEFLKERCLRKFVSKSGQVLKEGIRIKTVKLRGVVSQGLLIPIDQFPEITSRVNGEEIGLPSGEGEPAVVVQPLEGADVTRLLCVEHYDEIVEALRPATGGTVPEDAMGKFPSDFIPKTDEERIQNLGDWLTKMKGREFEVTEKNDGSSVTMFLSNAVDPEEPFGVCSRNLRLKPLSAQNGGIPIPWQMAINLEIEKKLKTMNEFIGGELALQGELVGPGINGNRDLYTKWEWHVFRIWDITHQKFVNPNKAADMCDGMSIPYVPVIDRGMKVFDTFSTIADILKFAEGKTANGHEREGLVFKTVDDGPYASFKAVSNRYLLKGD